MRKRLLSIILSMTMCVSILPMTAFADEMEEYNVWVNDEQFTSSYLIIQCGDGTAEFDPNEGVLTLTDATITWGYRSFAIYAEQDIDIVTVGTNVISPYESSGCSGIYANGDLTLSGEGSLDVEVADDKYDGIWVDEGDLTVAMAGKLTVDVADSKECGLYVDYDIKVTGSGDIDIIAGRYGMRASNVILSGSGDVTISSDESVAIFAKNLKVDGSGDIYIEDSESGISVNNVTLSGTGDFITTTKHVGLGVFGGDVVLSGTGKVDITSQDSCAVYISDLGKAVLLNGENSEVKFTASDEEPAVYNEVAGGAGTVAGDNIGKYDVEGAPEEKSVVYTLRTYNVTFDMGEHGTAPEDQTVAWDETIEKPSDPTADGYKFDGWYSDRACTKAFDFDVAYNVDTTIFAKWTCLHKNTEIRDAKDATLTSEGYTGDTYCKDCGEKLETGKAIPTLTPEPSGDPTPSPKPSGEPAPTTKPSGEPTPTSEPTPTNNTTPTVPPTTPTPASELDVGDFVDRCYEVALGREADEEGYNYWKNQLTNGEACGAQVGFGFIFSSEYANKNTTNEQFVTDMYSMFFGREADEAGYNYWLEQLNAGTATREQVFAGFANSEEFYNLCNKYGVVSGYYAVGVPNEQQGGVNCFVARLYKVCLNRLPDMGGQAGWVQKLMNGEVTGSTCAYGFVFSPEFINMNLGNSDFVNYMYKAFFGREADQDGLNYWVEQLNAGTATREDIFAGFSGSAEFANLCASYGINA